MLAWVAKYMSRTRASKHVRVPSGVLNRPGLLAAPWEVRRPAQRTGRLGLPMTLAYLGGNPAQAKATADQYRQASEDAGHPRAALGVCIASYLFIGASSQHARDTFYRAYAAAGRGIHLDRATFD